MADIETITVSEIFDHLKSRGTAAVLAWKLKDNECECHETGDPFVCLGLANRLLKFAEGSFVTEER